MTHAYNEEYVDDAMKNLGEAFDYATNSCGIDQDEFLDMFVVCGCAEQFGKGVPKYISGVSGTELAMMVIDHSGKKMVYQKPCIEYDCSPEYWCGWILAYYQWYTGRTFKNIGKYIKMRELLKLYPTLHEASEAKSASIIDGIVIEIESHSSTRLKQMRRLFCYSQKMLAMKSGVNIRMIQQYEQRVKDINKATGSGLLALSKALECRVEDLLEE